MNSVIDISAVSCSYGKHQVLSNIELSISAGEFIGLIGPNAAGKTTLVKAILGLIPIESGRITVLGDRPERSRRKIGYVAQKPDVNRQFPITVRDAVMLGRMGVSNYFGSYTAFDRQITQEILSLLEINDIADKKLIELSGGQMQRVWIARALVAEPEILILDEPTSNIDLITEENIFSILKEYNSTMTILIVSHDIAFISSYVNRVACINKTLICHDVESIDGKTIEELYGIDVNMIDHSH